MVIQTRKIGTEQNEYMPGEANIPGGGYMPTNDDYIGREETDSERNRRLYVTCQFIILMAVVGHDFVKAKAGDFADQLDQFSGSLNGESGPTALATKYGYTTAELLKIKNDAAYWRYWFTKHGAGATYAKQWTAKGEEARHGTGLTPSAWPVGTNVSGAPTDVAPGIEIRFREMAAKAKAQKSIYTEADGIAMAIEVLSTPFVPGAVKPDLAVEMGDGGHPLLSATKSGYQGFNVYKSVAGGAFTFLCTCNEADFKDMSALPAKGVTAAWTYRAFYVFDGAEVGPVSSEVTIAVLGLI